MYVFRENEASLLHYHTPTMQYPFFLDLQIADICNNGFSTTTVRWGKISRPMD